MRRPKKNTFLTFSSFFSRHVSPRHDLVLRSVRQALAGRGLQGRLQRATTAAAEAQQPDGAPRELQAQGTTTDEDLITVAIVVRFIF